jgi:hypothetical protein
MALTAQGWELVVDLVDRGGKVTTRTYPLVATDTAGDASDVLTDVATILTRLNGVTALVVKGYRVGKVFIEGALALPVSAEAELEQHALITAQVYGIANKSAVIDIPGPEQLVFLAASGPGADDVNFAQSEVDQYIAIWDGTAPLATISDGEEIDTNIVRGRKTHSRSQRG